MSQLLPILLDKEVYALELIEVQEVVENASIFPLPGASDALLGAISFHGQIVPVVDLPLLLGFAPGPRADRLIVLIDSHGPMALAVDQQRPILNIDLVQNTLIQSSSEDDGIRGVINWEGEMISLLDFEQMHLMIEQLCANAGG